MFGKVFASTYTGSMFGSGPVVFALWPYIIANADKRGYLELNSQMLASIIGCPEADITKAIEFLASPDPRSRSQVEEGRRIVREGQFAYRVVNYQHYRDILNQESRRAYNTKKKQEYRAKSKNNNHLQNNVDKCGQLLTNVDGQEMSAMSTHGEAEASSPLPPSNRPHPSSPPTEKENFSNPPQAGAHTSAPSPAATPNGFKAPTGPELYALNRSIDDLTAQLAKLPEKTNPSRAMIGGVLTLVPHPLAAKRSKIQAELDALLAKRSQILAPPPEPPTSKPVAP